jgi:hypothetical protein
MTLAQEASVPKALQLHVLAELMRNLHPYVDDVWSTQHPKMRFSNRRIESELNPQPLPPIDMGRPRIHEVASLVVSSMLQTLRTLDHQDEGKQKSSAMRMSRDIGELADWCGTVPTSERIRELLRKLGVPFPPVPDPEPWADWTSVVMSAVLFADAAAMMQQPELANAFNDAADRTLEAGLKMGGFA